ncbi:hypothetical protein C1J00_32530 [Streptomyces cahuitamycinicus]|uniref:Uncharacterized protein n=1 Tax=Streptomyces cahuitamycinicus TaxID=2070367 RepID=A0A2N8TGM9_9ACTN|nr:hypothetical protein C1J00_32530 [Streptomyces cahuitamycinicus]
MRCCHVRHLRPAEYPDRLVLLWPRATRTAMGRLMALVGVDTLQLGYSALMDKATGGCGRSGCVT